MRLVILGMGYSASAFLARERKRFAHVTGTVRDQGRATSMAAPGLEMLAFDGTSASPALKAAIHPAEAILVSIAPDGSGDPALRHLRHEIAAAPGLKWIGYLSTVGVYGDHGGDWVDETTPCKPVSGRSVARVAAENAWLDLGQATARPVQVFRLSGIYGPGRNALVNMMEGSARRIDKPGQVFNRIHVADIAGAVATAMDAAITRGHAPPMLNVTDNEPCPPQDIVAHAALLTGLETPPLIAFEDATLSPMGRSFYGENKRVSNRLLRENLGYSLAYPTYREGLAALWQEMRAG